MTANQAPTRTREEIVKNLAFRLAGDRVATKFEYHAADSIIAEAEARARSEAEAAPRPFQERVNDWMQACFGAEISADRQERNHRFLEEALELVQAAGCTSSEAHQLVDYVYGRPVGELAQEAGGVMVTFAALCLAHGIDGSEAAETELARVWTKVEKIRAKQAAKPKHSPLPEAAPPDDSAEKIAWLEAENKKLRNAITTLADSMCSFENRGFSDPPLRVIIDSEGDLAQSRDLFEAVFQAVETLASAPTQGGEG